MGWVWNHSRSSNGSRLVLLAIADCASDDGSNAWPSVKTLADKANLSVRAVQNAIQDLERLGELKVEWNKGQKGSNRYTVLMKTPAESAPPQNLRPEESAGGETGAEPGTPAQEPPQILRPADSAPPQISTETPADSAPKPSRNRPTTKKTSSSLAPKPKRAAKAPKPKEPDPLGDTAQELTTAFVEKFKGDNLQPFPAIRGVVKSALARDIPRNVLAHALNALGEAGLPVSGGTLTTELGRMRKAASGQNGGGMNAARGSNDQYLAAEMEWALQMEAQEAARQQQITFEEIPT